MTAPPKFGDAIAVGGVRKDPLLWCLHVIGPDDVYAAPDFATAGAWAANNNRVTEQYTIARGLQNEPHWPFVRSVVAIWPGSAEEHAKDLPKNIATCSSMPTLAHDDVMAWHYSHPRTIDTYVEGKNKRWSQSSGWTETPLYALATSTALPLAHPAAPQGEAIERLRQVCQRVLDRGYISSCIDEEKGDHDDLVAALAALAPAAIASGREGAAATEAEREACIRILEDMRPRNDQSDWNEFTVTTDTILRLAIEAINRRYPS